MLSNDLVKRVDIIGVGWEPTDILALLPQPAAGRSAPFGLPAFPAGSRHF
jgi:hypothetical protein